MIPPDDTPSPWTRTSRSLAYENAWIQVYHDEVLRPDGEPGVYGVVHPRTHAVGVVALDEHDRVLLVGQYRYTLERYSWEIPEGGVPIGDDPLEGARRELAEETGYRAATWQLLGRFWTAPGFTTELMYLYLATDLVAAGDDRLRPEADERLHLVRLPWRDAVTAAERGEIADAKSIVGLFWLARLRGE